MVQWCQAVRLSFPKLMCGLRSWSGTVCGRNLKAWLPPFPFLSCMRETGRDGRDESFSTVFLLGKLRSVRFCLKLDKIAKAMNFILMVIGLAMN